MSKKRDFRLQHEITERVAAQAHAGVLEEQLAALKAPPPAPAAPPPPAPAPRTFRVVRDQLRSENRHYEAADVTLQSTRFGGLDAPVPPPKDAA